MEGKEPFSLNESPLLLVKLGFQILDPLLEPAHHLIVVEVVVVDNFLVRLPKPISWEPG